MFEDISFTWKGETKKVRSNNVMKLISIIEDHVTYFKLCGEPPLAKCSQAYAAALSYAGFENVKAEEIYAGFFRGDYTSISAISTLLAIMMPPEQMIEQAEKKQLTETSRAD